MNKYKNLQKSKSINKKKIRKTKKQKQKQKQIKKGGGEKLGIIIYESPTRKGFPISKIVNINDENLGLSQQFENYLNDVYYDAEDFLYSLKENQKGIIMPKKIKYQEIDIEKPVYIPPYEI